MMVPRVIFLLFFLKPIWSRPNEDVVKISKPKQCKLDPKLVNEISSYQPLVDIITEELTRGNHKGQVYQELADFIDKFGNRISGSKNLESAIDYMLNRSNTYKLDNVHGEPVTVPRWHRKTEKALLMEPLNKPMSIMALGSSVATPKQGIVAEAIVVKTFEQLKKHADKAKGKIVVFAPDWESYGKTVKYRQFGASEAAAVGAVASLIRSITPFSINSPHTGLQDYRDNVTKIPTACITVEDAEMLHRMYRRGSPIKIYLNIQVETGADQISRNTVVEVTGKEQPGKVVLVSGHLDSWDVGTGAMDDGGGAFISWYTTVLFKSLNLRPRRTVRAVLWTGEEEGLLGAFEYRRAHAAEKNNLILLMESDIGTFTPLGLTFKGSNNAVCIIQEILKLFSELNATQLEISDDVGSDIQAWQDDNIPLASLKNDNAKYFWFHHSDGDTMTLEDSDTLDKCAAVWAATAYIVADMSLDLPR